MAVGKGTNVRVLGWRRQVLRNEYPRGRLDVTFCAGTQYSVGGDADVLTVIDPEYSASRADFTSGDGIRESIKESMNIAATPSTLR
jgi:hypothetical protein